MSARNPQIYVITDYGVGDPAFVEVYQRISNLIPEATIKEISVAPFSTTQTGFWAYQLALDHDQIERMMGYGKARKTYLFLNTAPRRDYKGPRTDNEGERLVYARLSDGIEMVGALSGESFSFVKPMIERLQLIDVPSSGSQFRSRDIFPLALRGIVDRRAGMLGRQLSVGSIPDPAKGYRIAHVDGYGNMKLTVRESQSRFGVGYKLVVMSASGPIGMTRSEGIFGVREGELCLAPGSSGPAGDNFMEVSKRGGSAWEELGRPGIESELRIDGAGSRRKRR